MIRTFDLARLVLVLAAVAPMLGACGSEESPPPAPAPASSALAGAASTSPDNKATSNSVAPCTDKQVRECRVELGQQGTVQNCFVGLELCSNGAWGSCLSAAEIEAQLNSQ